MRDFLATTGTLRVWLDRGRGVVCGAVTRNTLVPADLRMVALSPNGNVMRTAVSANRTGQVEGYIDTSRGRVCARRRTHVAAVAIARKIAVIVWHLLTRCEDYA